MTTIAVAIVERTLTTYMGTMSKRATTNAVALVKRALTSYMGSHEPIYKTITKNETKRLNATNFVIAELEER